MSQKIIDKEPLSGRATKIFSSLRKSSGVIQKLCGQEEGEEVRKVAAEKPCPQLQPSLGRGQ